MRLVFDNTPGVHNGEIARRFYRDMIEALHYIALQYVLYQNHHIYLLVIELNSVRYIAQIFHTSIPVCIPVL